MELSKNLKEKDDQLNDSWVELHFRERGSSNVSSPRQSGTQTPRTFSAGASFLGELPTLSRPVNIYSGQIEKLLLDAQNESRSSSRTTSRQSSRTSPKSPPNSPNHEFSTIPEKHMINKIEAQPMISDWIWDWSSRPEVAQSSDGLAVRYRHPNHQRPSSPSKPAVKENKSYFGYEIIPTLLSHACTFIMGAAVMCIYLKKYSNWSTSAVID